MWSRPAPQRPRWSRGGGGWVALGMVVSCIAGLGGCESGDARERRDVLLVTIDTLRADYVHAYGFELESTPNIDALAARGVLFERAIAAATVTAPAHASIMTGRYAREHSIGVRNGDSRLEGHTTLAEAFRAAGYDTAAFVSNVVLRRRTGLDRGFDLYDDELTTGESNRQAYFERVAERTAGRAMDWLAARGERPFFLWVHLQDPHGPYAPPEPYRSRVDAHPLRVSRPLKVLKTNVGRAGIPAYQALDAERNPALYAARYVEEIMYADHWVGEVVAAAEAASADRGLVALLTADHGESLGERGFFFQHGQATTPDLARVPFIVVAPGIESRRSREPVSHVDIAPTLLDLSGAGGDLAATGLSLTAMLNGDEPLPERTLHCDTDGEAGAYRGDRFTRLGGSIASDRVPDVVQPTQAESLDVSEAGLWRTDDLDVGTRDALLRYIEARAPLVAAGEMAPEHIEQLRALGYLPPAEEGDEPGH